VKADAKQQRHRLLRQLIASGEMDKQRWPAGASGGC